MFARREAYSDGEKGRVAAGLTLNKRYFPEAHAGQAKCSQLLKSYFPYIIMQYEGRSAHYGRTIRFMTMLLQIF